MVKYVDLCYVLHKKVNWNQGRSKFAMTNTSLIPSSKKLKNTTLQKHINSHELILYPFFFQHSIRLASFIHWNLFITGVICTWNMSLWRFKKNMKYTLIHSLTRYKINNQIHTNTNFCTHILFFFSQRLIQIPFELHLRVFFSQNSVFKYFENKWNGLLYFFFFVNDIALKS